MARVYIRIESANKASSTPTPGEAAAALRVANTIAEALGLDATEGKPRRRATPSLRGVTLRLDVVG